MLIVISFSFIVGFTANVARFAVAPAIVTHAMFNTVSRFLNGLFKDVQPSATIPFELVLAFGGFCVGLMLILLTRRRLGMRHVERKGFEHL